MIVFAHSLISLSRLPFLSCTKGKFKGALFTRRFCAPPSCYSSQYCPQTWSARLIISEGKGRIQGAKERDYRERKKGTWRQGGAMVSCMSLTGACLDLDVQTDRLDQGIQTERQTRTNRQKHRHMCMHSYMHTHTHTYTHTRTAREIERGRVHARMRENVMKICVPTLRTELKIYFLLL